MSVSWLRAASGPRGGGVRAGAGSPAVLVRRIGRVVLWLLVLVLLLRGVASVLSAREPAPAAAASAHSAASWPDEPARAFAAVFTRAYLSFDPDDAEGSAEAIRGLVSSEIAGLVEPEYAEDAPRRGVGSVSIARVERVDASHALITVAAAVSGGGTRYLVVPVARDGRGGLVVSDLPSLAAPPARAAVPSATTEALPADERGAIEDVVGRVLRAYLAGDAGALAYLVPPGVRLGALDSEHELVELVSVGLIGSAHGSARDVLASVRARDGASGAVYGLRYRLRLERQGGRWLVAAVNTTHKGG